MNDGRLLGLFPWRSDDIIYNIFPAMITG